VHQFPFMMNCDDELATSRPTIGVFGFRLRRTHRPQGLVALIPGADYLYFGDTARLPYGSKSGGDGCEVRARGHSFSGTTGGLPAGDRLQHATALALDQITSAAHVPVIGCGRARCPAGLAGQQEWSRGRNRHRSYGEQATPTEGA